jgi:hypothetical protein
MPNRSRATNAVPRIFDERAMDEVKKPMPGYGTVD